LNKRGWDQVRQNISLEHLQSIEPRLRSSLWILTSKTYNSLKEAISELGLQVALEDSSIRVTIKAVKLFIKKQPREAGRALALAELITEIEIAQLVQTYKEAGNLPTVRLDFVNAPLLEKTMAVYDILMATPFAAMAKTACCIVIDISIYYPRMFEPWDITLKAIEVALQKFLVTNSPIEAQRAAQQAFQAAAPFTGLQWIYLQPPLIQILRQALG
jgi:hypothetical protein